jgi:hypothetical protein
VVGAALGIINLPQLYSHTGGDLHVRVSELMVMCACQYFRLATWSSRHSLDLARSVSRRFTGVRGYQRRCWGPGKVDALKRGCWSEGG